MPRQQELAIEMIHLGAAVSVIAEILFLPKRQLLHLYHVITNVVPPKGSLPFSTQWFLSWRPNLHAAIFYQYYSCLRQQSSLSETKRLIEAYRLYLAWNIQFKNEQPLLSFNRAWILIRFINVQLLFWVVCPNCQLPFIYDSFYLNSNYFCHLCRLPRQAGRYKSKKAS